MISICIPLKNRAENLIRCLDSMRGIKGDFEVVIGDNYSDDINWEALAHAYEFEITVARWEGDWSIGKAKNVAAESAKGDILFFLDADVVVVQEVIDKIVRLVPEGWVYAPIMWMENEDRKTGDWGVHSFGQVAVTKQQWEDHKWVEWKSYGGDDNMFVEPYKLNHTMIRDTPDSFIHHWHPHEERTKNYKNNAGYDLDIERKRRGLA